MQLASKPAILWRASRHKYRPNINILRDGVKILNDYSFYVYYRLAVSENTKLIINVKFLKFWKTLRPCEQWKFYFNMFDILI